MCRSVRIRLILGLALVTVVATGHATAQADKPENGIQPAQDQILGSRSAIDPHDPDYLWLEKGAEIRQSAQWNAPVIAIVDIRVQVPIAHQQGDWLLVRYAGWKGWIHRTGEKEIEADEPFSTTPDEKTLDRALEVLRPQPDTPRTLGPFALYTDVPGKRLIGFLDKVAANVLSAYAQRYGLAPGEETREAVVLFAREQDYRAFTRTTTETPGLVAGHATRGIAIVAVGDQSRDEVAAVLVHELTHLLNRRVFKSVELPWADEGMANDLAYCQIGRWSGALNLGTLGGRSVVINRPVYLAGGQSRVDREIHLEGPVASLSLLRDSQNRLPLDELITMQPAEFMDPLDLHIRYDQSTFFIRFLLDSDNPDLARAFRAYLGFVTTQPSPGENISFPAHAGLDPEQLSERFEGWLQDR